METNDYIGVMEDVKKNISKQVQFFLISFTQLSKKTFVSNFLICVSIFLTRNLKSDHRLIFPYVLLKVLVDHIVDFFFKAQNKNRNWALEMPVCISMGRGQAPRPFPAL